MRNLSPVPVALTLAVLAGCASGPPRQTTTADLARANTLVAAAEQSGAQQYAAADLQAARDKAQQANELGKHDAKRADQLANEAAVDAQLASARAQNAQAQHGLSLLHQSLKTLRSEERRDTNATPAAPPPHDTPQSEPPQNQPPQGPAPLNQEPPADQNSPPQSGTPPGAAGLGNPQK
jgi:hypothetical protein